MTKKEILKALQNKKQNPFYNNDSLFECIYCQIVVHNDTIKEFKNELKGYKKDLKTNHFYISEKYTLEHIKYLKEQIKEYRKKRNELQQASFYLLGDNFSDYNE